jgi:hypothetical protein
MQEKLVCILRGHFGRCGDRSLYRPSDDPSGQVGDWERLSLSVPDKH